MPSAMNGDSSVHSTSPELGAAPGPLGAAGPQTETLKQVLNVIEKKVRNMEKKKSKLEDYKSKKNKGENLNADQLEALSKVQEVTHNLDFARELQKSFMALVVDLQKAEKKASRREQVRREEQERRRLQRVLEVQLLLERLGEDEVRVELQRASTPSRGDQEEVQGEETRLEPVLSAAQLTSLDSFYKLVNPERDSNARLTEQFEEASVHMWDLLEGKDKPVAGTTYKALKETMERVLQSDSFQRLHTQPNGVCEEEPPTAVEPAGPTTAVSKSPEVEELPEPAVTEVTADQDYTEAGVETKEFVNLEYVPEETSLENTQEETTAQWTTEVESQVPQQPVLAEAPPPVAPPTPPVPMAADPLVRKQVVQDLMAQMQGTCNFMQDSMLDFDGQVMDPAIVSVQTMSPAHSLDRPPMGCPAVHSEAQLMAPTSAATAQPEVFNLNTPPMPSTNEVDQQKVSSQYPSSFSPTYTSQPTHSESPSNAQPDLQAGSFHSQDALQAAGAHQALSQQALGQGAGFNRAGPPFFGSGRGGVMSRGAPRAPRGSMNGYRGGYEGYRPPFPAAVVSNYGQTQFGNAPREYSNSTYQRDGYQQQGVKRGAGPSSRGASRGNGQIRS